MIDIEREFEILINKLNRYKTKKLGFEYGAIVGYVTKINLIKYPTEKKPWAKAIEVRGIAGLDSEERVLMVITENWRKNRNYKYWTQYHILELIEAW